jgi:hypothetical protein
VIGSPGFHPGGGAGTPAGHASPGFHFESSFNVCPDIGVTSAASAFKDTAALALAHAFAAFNSNPDPLKLLAFKSSSCGAGGLMPDKLCPSL